MRTHVALTPLTVALLALGCNSSPNTTAPNPDQIRQDTAAATSTIVRDGKAAAEGIKDGIRSATSTGRGPASLPLDINRGNRLALMTLPGVDSRIAARIIANRPYTILSDLRTRRIVSSDEYEQMASRIIVTH